MLVREMAKVGLEVLRRGRGIKTNFLPCNVIQGASFLWSLLRQCHNVVVEATEVAQISPNRKNEVGDCDVLVTTG